MPFLLADMTAPEPFYGAQHPVSANLYTLGTSGNGVTLIWEPNFQITQEIEIGDRTFQLRNPVQVRVSFDEGLWVNENETLGITAFGESRASALRSFCEDFGVLWDTIAQEADNNLTSDARTLKSAFNGIVEGVRRTA
jgi:hypothetical protein